MWSILIDVQIEELNWIAKGTKRDASQRGQRLNCQNNTPARPKLTTIRH